MHKKLRHLSLFSVYFFDNHKFNDVFISNVVGMEFDDKYLWIGNKILDLDVFLSEPSYFCYKFRHPIAPDCEKFVMLSYPSDLFAYFSSVLVRMYLNLTMEFFSDLFSKVRLSDEGFIIDPIFSSAKDLLDDFFATNDKFFFMNFLNVFGELNLSACYDWPKNKPEYGPYFQPEYTVGIIRF